MGISKKLIALFTFCYFFTACGPQNQQENLNWPVNFEELITLHCRAIELRESRFEIADSLRFLNDSLSNRTDTSFSSETAEHLKKLYKRQEVVSAEGYALADTIRNRMTLVMSDLDPVQKRSFNDSVAVAVSRRGCDIGDQF